MVADWNFAHTMRYFALIFIPFPFPICIYFHIVRCVFKMLGLWFAVLCEPLSQHKTTSERRTKMFIMIKHQQHEMGYINVEKGTVSQSIVFEPKLDVCVQVCGNAYAYVFVCVFCVLLYLVFCFSLQLISCVVRLSLSFVQCVLSNSPSIFLTSFLIPVRYFVWINIFYFVLHFYFNVTISQFCGYVYMVYVHMYKFHSQSVNGLEYGNRFPWHRTHTYTHTTLAACMTWAALQCWTSLSSKSKTDRFSILTSCNNRTTCFLSNLLQLAL